MHHYIYHPSKGWLNPHSTQCLEWVKESYQTEHFSADELGLALLALGMLRQEVVIIPGDKDLPARYVLEKPIEIVLTDAQYDWLKERISPQWDGYGNCSWFVDHNDRSYGPIGTVDYGGFTVPYKPERYESILGAAAVMMRDVEGFKGV